MPGKARVHELAKEFGVDSKTVLAKLKEQGEFVKSASSTVEAPVARRLREALGSETGGGNGPAAPKPAARPSAPAPQPAAAAAPAAAAPAAPVAPAPVDAGRSGGTSGRAVPRPAPGGRTRGPQAPAASAPDPAARGCASGGTPSGRCRWVRSDRRRSASRPASRSASG